MYSSGTPTLVAAESRMRQHFRSSLSSFRATHEGSHHPIEAGAVKFLSRLLNGLVVDHEAVLVGGDLHRLTLVDLALQNQLGERVLHILLDHALQRPRAVSRVVALLP